MGERLGDSIDSVWWFVVGVCVVRVRGCGLVGLIEIGFIENGEWVEGGVELGFVGGVAGSA